MKKYGILFVLCFINMSLSSAAAGPDLKTLIFKVEMKSENPLSFQFTPPAAHHFNQEAPSKVEMSSGADKKTAHIGKALQKITADFPDVKSLAKDCHLTANLYLCNDQNTYCVPVKQEYDCRNLATQMAPAAKASATEAVASNPSEENGIEPKNFIINDFEKALKQAQAENKMLLIDFFGIWCPPCNVLDETVFNRKDFQDLGRQYVFLKMDSDKTENFSFKSKYQVKGYPSVILANSKSEEINRIVGSRQPIAFIAEMKRAAALKASSLSERKAFAESGKSPATALELTKMYVNQEDFWSAQKYLQLSFGAKPVELKKLSLSIQIGLLKETAKEPEQKKMAADLLETWIKANTHMVEAVEWQDYLGSLAEDLKDEGLKSRAKALQIEVAKNLLQDLKKNKSLLNEAEVMPADLYAVLGESEEESNPIKSKEYYLLAVDSYRQEIKKSGIPLSRERGNNLEIAYCLFKAGKGDEALSLYETLEKTYPEEFTFFYAHASVLQKMGKSAEALPKAQVALKYSYGDNQLRSAFLVADLESKLGQKKEALSLVNETLLKFPVDKTLKVRQNRYVEKLQQLKTQL